MVLLGYKTGFKGFFVSLDFKVKWQGSEEATSDEIIVNWVYKRLKAGMPVTTITHGKSRSGKSRYMLKLQDRLYAKYGIDFVSIVKDVVLIKPRDWGKKARAIFEEKTPEAKQALSIQMDEAKFLLNAADWQKLKNRTIRTIAATSGVIKPVWFIIIAQNLKDVDPKTRETCDLIMDVRRSPGNKPTVTCTLPYEKIVDLSTIKIMPRGFNGNIVYPDGKQEHVLPVFRPSLPRKEIEHAYSSFERSDKTEQIFALFDELDKETEKLVGEEKNKLRETAEFLVAHPEELQKIASIKHNKYKMGLAARKRFEEFTEKDFKRLEEFVNGELKRKAETEANKKTDLEKKELEQYGLSEQVPA